MELIEGFHLLEKYNIPVVKYWIVDGKIPQDINYPVVLKISQKDILHKTEKGGIITDINNENELMEGINLLRKKFPEAKIIIQKQLPKTFREVIVSVKRDPTFEEFVLIGIGGIYTELLKDFVILIPPFDKNTFIRMLKELKLKDVLFGYRNTPAVNLEILYDVSQKLYKILKENPEINEIEINPFMINDKEGYAVDVRIL